MQTGPDDGSSKKETVVDKAIKSVPKDISEADRKTLEKINPATKK
jgi:hypothetical protein